MKKQINQERFTSPGVIMDKTSNTIPDQSLSVNEILRGHVRSYDSSYYDTEGLTGQVERMDKVDREVFAKNNMETINRIAKEHQSKVAESEKRRLEEIEEKLKKAEEISKELENIKKTKNQ